ncbi:MAG: hypothetical protein R3F21_17380 [Myxococcota bacterium]
MQSMTTDSGAAAPREFLAKLGDRADRLLAAPGWIQLGAWLLVLLLLKADVLFEPPVWDSAMGVFPPAIYLYENGFDIRGLLAEPNWWFGGPNVHSLSIYTWLLAVVMAVTDSAPATFAIVRLVTFALVAGSLVLFGRALRADGFRPATIFAASFFVLGLPLVSVQIGYLYTEAWVMALGVAAWAYWRLGKPGVATAICAIALFVKLTAIAIVACVVLALVLSQRPGRVRRWALLAGLALALVVNRGLPGWLGATVVDHPRWGEPAFLAKALLERLAAIPDVTLLVLLALAGTLVRSLAFAAGGLAPGRLFGLDWRRGAQVVCLALPFVFSAGIVHSIFSESLFLPRYLVPIIPFAVASILDHARAAGKERIALIGLCIGCAFNLANRSGALYRPDHQSFSIVERSAAYHDFHRLQIELIEGLEKLPADMPVFVSKEIHYMLSSPMMGYAVPPLPQIRPVFLPPYRGAPLEAFPPEFVLVLSNSGHGGEEVLRLARAAERDPNSEVRVRRVERSGFSGALVWVRRAGAPAVGAIPRAPALAGHGS